jgi:hypothetical protein
MVRGCVCTPLGPGYLQCDITEGCRDLQRLGELLIEYQHTVGPLTTLGESMDEEALLPRLYDRLMAGRAEDKALELQIRSPRSHAACLQLLESRAGFQERPCYYQIWRGVAWLVPSG